MLTDRFPYSEEAFKVFNSDEYWQGPWFLCMITLMVTIWFLFLRCSTTVVDNDAGLGSWFHRLTASSSIMRVCGFRSVVSYRYLFARDVWCCDCISSGFICSRLSKWKKVSCSLFTDILACFLGCLFIWTGRVIGNLAALAMVISDREPGASAAR